MQTRTVVARIALACALFTAGCENARTSARIQEHSAVFAQLTPAQQEQIRHGGIEPGYTQDMVYMSLGHPTRVITSPNGRDTTWIYKNYIAPSASPQANFQWGQGTQGGAVRFATSREAGNVSTGNAAYPRGRESPPMSSTAATGPEPSMEVPDLPTQTFFVTFRGNRVIAMRFEE